MSVAELKQAVEVLSVEERLELADYLRSLSKQDDPAWPVEVGRRLDRCLAGQGHSREELREAHEHLSAEGR